MLINSRQGSQAAQDVAGVQELIEQILSHLDIRDLMRTMRVSKHFNATVNNAPGVQETLLRCHLPTAHYPLDPNGRVPRRAAGLNIYLERTAPALFRNSGNASAYGKNDDRVVIVGRKLRSLAERRVEPKDIFLDRQAWETLKPLFGKDYYFRVLCISVTRGTTEHRCNRLALRLEMTRLDSRAGQKWKNCGRNGLERRC